MLILGSLPSQRSLLEGQYYAHPQNAFWRVMRDVVGAEGSYAERCSALIDARIAVWDVLRSSVRPGSMDADIQLHTAEANDFEGFLAAHGDIGLICFNGRKSEQMFHRFFEPDTIAAGRRLASLPSTSPAFASMSYADKLAIWRNTILNTEGIQQ